MAEEFLQGVVCGGNWWNSPRNLFSSSPCSLASANDIGSFGWPSHALMTTEMKSVGSSDESGCSAASDVRSSSLVLHDVHSSDQQPPADGWNQDLLRDSGRSEENYCDFLLDSSINYRPQMKQSFGVEQQQQPLNSLSSSAECMTTCRGQSAAAAGFPLISSGQDSYSYASSLLQTLFDTDSERQQSLLDHQAEMSYSSPSSSAANAYHQLNSNGFLPSLQPTANTNNAPLWNATAESFTNVRPTFPPSPPSHFLSSSHTNHKPQFHSIGANKQHQQGKDLTTVVKKASSEPAFKRPRIETPSPLPTFKVRKEKLGDRITALQQLVSPFGKTDTASVLHEAIEYIKFLHDQVNSLSTPYLKYGSPPVQRQQGADTSKDEEGLTKDLKTRGLCLVPISSTFPVAAETTADFWTPTFSGSFR